MLPILDQLSSLKRRALPLSVKAWHQMIASGMAPKRAELIRGVIIEKMSKSILHFKLTDLLIEMIRVSLGQHFWVRQEAPLTLDDSEPEPDISVVSGKRSDYSAHPGTAKIVVEVSVSTLAEDRAMAEIYAEAGVEEFWIVNAVERCLEVYQSPAGGHYQTLLRVPEGEVLQSAALAELKVDVSALFAGLPAAI